MTVRPARPRRTVALLGAGAVALAVAIVGTVVALNPPDPILEGPRAEPTATKCEHRDLPVPETVDGDLGGAQARTSASGEYVAGVVRGTWIRWRDGEVIDFDRHTPDAEPVAVNSEGTVVFGDSGVVVDVDGESTRLAGPQGARALAIADTGVVVGNVVGETGEGEPKELTPLIWVDGEAVELDLEPGMRGGARAVTAAGDVLGYQVGAKADNEVGATPWLWRADGTGVALPQPHESSAAVPLDVAGDWVLAKSATRSDTFRYRLSRPEDVDAFDADRDGYRIDATGRVYGSVDGRGAYWDGTAEPVRLPGDDDGAIDDVSDDGTVLVGARFGAADTTAVGRWTCER